MSLRFYVNGIQIFGNNEMFPLTEEELTSQGAKWYDGGFDMIEIKDPQSLMQAVEEDICDFLKEVLRKDFEEIRDEDLLLGSPVAFKNYIWDKNGVKRENIWERLLWWLEDKRIFTSFNLYLAIKDDVDYKNGKLILKEGHNIVACMF